MFNPCLFVNCNQLESCVFLFIQLVDQVFGYVSKLEDIGVLIFGLSGLLYFTSFMFFKEKEFKEL